MNNILVLGGSGFLGRNIANILSDTYKISSYDLVLSSFLNSNIKQYSGTLSEIDKLENCIIQDKITTIIHCVSSLVPTSDKDAFLIDIQKTYICTDEIIQLCIKYNVKLIFLSSGGVLYKESNKCHCENDPLNPLSYYAVSKLNIETLIHFYHNKSNLNYLILRPSNPYGIGQNMYGKQGLIATIFGKIIKNEPIEVWGDGSAIRDYLFIEDFKNVIYKLISNNVNNTTVNIGSGVGTSINEILYTVEKILDKKLNVNYLPSKTLAVKNNILNISYLQSLIDFKPVPIYEGIKQYYEELKKTGVFK